MNDPNPPDRHIWIDGELVPWGEATVHLLSHSLQRGSLVFDYMSVHEHPQGDAVFRLADHVSRFVRSCGLVGLPLAHDESALEAAVLETVVANPGARAAKLCAYLPSVEIDVVPADDHVSVAVAAYDPRADIAARKPKAPPFKPQLRVWIEKEQRQRRREIIPPQAKVAANYTSPMIAKWRARQQGFDEVLLVDEHGHVAEGPTTNVFLVDAEGALCTPPEAGVLPGVTRRSIIELAKHDGIEVREEPIHPEELLRAAEVFLTGTTAGVWPVCWIDDRTIGEGEPGPVSLLLRDHFGKVVSGQDPAFEHWLSVAAPVTGD